MHYIIGIIGVAAGIYYLKYSFQIANFTGSIGFAERYLGSGGTYLLHKIIGLLIIVISVLYAFGGLQSIAGKIFGRFV